MLILKSSLENDPLNRKDLIDNFIRESTDFIDLNIKANFDDLFYFLCFFDDKGGRAVIRSNTDKKDIIENIRNLADRLEKSDEFNAE